MTWGIGLTIYLLLGVVAGAIAPIYVPWLGMIFILGCLSVHVHRRPADERVLLPLAMVQVGAAILTTMLVGLRSSDGGRWGLNVALMIGVFGPIFIAVYALRKARRTPATNPSLHD